MNDDELKDFHMVTCGHEAICVTKTVADEIDHQIQLATVQLADCREVVRPRWFAFRDLFGERTSVRLDLVSCISRCSVEGRALERLHDEYMRKEIEEDEGLAL